MEKINPTVADGVACAIDWQRGDTAPLDRWEKLYLTDGGIKIMRGLTRTMPAESIRELVIRAVAFRGASVPQ